MESKGTSVPEPASPLGMKPPPDAARKGHAGTDPAPPTDPAAALQDGVLQKTAGHNHHYHHHNHHHHHERLKDLTSRVLNGDQDKPPKLCSPPDTPVLKGADAPPPITSLQRKAPPPHADLGLKGQITQLAGEVVLSGEEVKKRKGRALKTKAPATSSPPTTTTSPAASTTISPPTTTAPPATTSNGTTTTSPPTTTGTTTSPPTAPGTTTSTLATSTTGTPATSTTGPPATSTTGPPSPSMACLQPARSLEQEVKDEEEVKVAEDKTEGHKVQEVEAVKEQSSPAASFSVGDVVWTKVSGYPWWPCMVSTDPELERHAKPKLRANGPPGLLYHVQYFGDCPERGYILERSMVSFHGEDQYEELSQASKQPASRVVHKRGTASVPRKFRAQWSVGVGQAREALSLPLDQRMDKFTYVYDRDGLRLNPHVAEKLKPEEAEARERGAESRLVRTDEPARRGASAGKKPAAAASVERKAAKGRKAGKRAQSGSVTIQRDPSRAKENPLPHSQESTSAVGSEPPGEVGETQKRKKVQTQTQRTKSLSAASSTPAAGRKPSRNPPVQTALSVKKRRKKAAEEELKSGPVTAKRKTSVKSPLTDSTAQQTDHQPNRKQTDHQPNRKQTDHQPNRKQTDHQPNRKQTDHQPNRKQTDHQPNRKQTDHQPNRKRNAGRQTDKLKCVQLQVLKPEPPPQRKRKTTEEDAKSAKKKQKGSVSGDQSPERQQRGKRKREVDHQSKAKKRRSSPCPESEGSGSEERPDSPSDGLDDPKKSERLTGVRKELVCQVCEQPGEDLQACEGRCCGMFHLSCLGMAVKPEDKLLCPECTTGIHPCFTCKQTESPEGAELRRCYVPHCGKSYHEGCARLSPLSVFDQRGLRCPLHTCLSCHLGGRSNGRATKGKMMRCLRCPVAYHVGELCVSAGSQVVSSTALVCTAHFNAKKGYSHHSHVNVSWCFVCSKGGQLLCCESCPAAFHPDCLNISMPEGSWFCNDCRAGKKPKYQDVIWVKLGTYRWWPAEIRHPRTVPTNIQHLRHHIGEFPVFFFGSKDFFWTHQGRVFPYMEGDRGSKHQKTNIGKVFKNALLEAEARFKETKLKREAKEAKQNNKKPPPYKFIKVNKPCGKVQVSTADVSEIPKCNCKPSDERPCGFESECLNRMLLYECHPQVCPNGARCCNQDFTKRLYPDTKIIKTAGKGWGLVCLRDIKKGEFVNEYVGELIDEEECRARIRYAQENNISHFYMLTIDKDRIIDAGPKGNYSRFMNHSCQPNCETQKWTVNGDTRVGLFAVCHVPAGTELTFNYNLDCLGNEKTVCRCGAPNCSGFLGDRPKASSGAPSEVKVKRAKRRKRRSGGKRSEDECFRCGDGGQLVICGKKSCTKAYHLACLGLAKRPFGRWDCPWHHCDVCGKASEAFCQLCPNSFCSSHQEGALQDRPSSSQLCCLEHDHQVPPPLD